MTTEAPTGTAVRRPTWWSALATSALVVLSRPTLVALALAGFLARGGILVLLLPIVVLPTPAGLANVFAPFVVQLYFGHVSLGVITVGLAFLVGAAAWLILGGLVGAASDLALIAAAARDDELKPQPMTLGDGSAPSLTTGNAARAMLIRLIAHLPLIVVLAWGAGRIYQATYSELTSPFEVLTPLVVRVLSDVPDALAAALVTWLLGEVAGGLGVRYFLLDGRSAPRALLTGWWHLLRYPLWSLATMLATNAPVLVAAAVGYTIASIGWGLVLSTVLGPGDPLLAVGAVVGLVAAWLAGLILIGLVTCWRSVAWTAEWLRVHQPDDARADSGSVRAVGTIGGKDDARPGDWSSADRSGTV